MEYDAKIIKCPYYIENNSKYQEITHQIRCEGVEHVGQICLLFNSAAKRRAHKREFCYSTKDYHKCPVASELDKRWEEKIWR